MTAQTKLRAIARENDLLYDEIKARYGSQLPCLSALYKLVATPMNIQRVRFDTTEITIEPVDALVCARDMVQTHRLNPVVLNCASPRRAGGKYRIGKVGQEEALFYQSTYAFSLEPSYNAQVGWFYPLTEDAAIYSPAVLVTRDKDYQLMEDKDRFFVSFVACAALEQPGVGLDHRLNRTAAALMEQKIRLLFRIAILNGHDSLVLGAFGSGVYKNPPLHVAQLFKKVIFDSEFFKAFKSIKFAIVDSRNYEAYCTVFRRA